MTWYTRTVKGCWSCPKVNRGTSPSSSVKFGVILVPRPHKGRVGSQVRTEGPPGPERRDRTTPQGPEVFLYHDQGGNRVPSPLFLVFRQGQTTHLQYQTDRLPPATPVLLRRRRLRRESLVPSSLQVPFRDLMLSLISSSGGRAHPSSVTLRERFGLSPSMKVPSP